MQEIARDRGSFRDPSGYVFQWHKRIFRVVEACARESYEWVRDSGALCRLQNEGDLVATREVPPESWPGNFGRAAYVLEHPRIPFVSYPYEWSFSGLKAAALHHLDLQLKLLQSGITLSDASAFNVQFMGARPIFIDVLSLRPYHEGEFWQGHRQFCEQFLNPLLLTAFLGIAHNAWFRGALEGIPTSDLARLIPLRRRFSWNVVSHILLQAKLDAKAKSAPDSAIRQVKAQRQLSRAAYQGLLFQLRRWISKLHPADVGTTVWATYAQTNTYSEGGFADKQRFVREFAAKTAPEMLIDIGCNTGDYSVAALEGGARYVVGFDFDQQALEVAYRRAADKNLPFLPLWLDAANPSPDQGWRQAERIGFDARARADAVIALAFEHHLAIGRNVPLPQVLDWLIAIAPTGIIEFVPKSDPTIQRMLALRSDIFDDYNQEAFSSLLEQRARIVHRELISGSGRMLYWYDRGL